MVAQACSDVVMAFVRARCGKKGGAWACPVGLEVSNRGLLLHPGVGCFSLSIAGSYEPGVRRNELSAPIAL